MGPFVIQKVARLYGQQVTIEDPDGPSGKGTWARLCVVYASHFAPFDKPDIEPQEITLDGLEEIAKPI